MLRYLNQPVMVAALAAVLTGCFTSAAPVNEVRGQVLGGDYSVKWVGDPLPASELAGKVARLLQAFEQQMSAQQENSDLSRFNRLPAGGCMQLQGHFLRLATAAVEFHRFSDGALDVTLAPLLRIWGVHSQPQSQDRRGPPDPQQLAAVLPNLGQQHLHLQDDLLCKDVPLELDFSSIASGYLVDQLELLLRDQLIESYMIELPGDLKAVGQKAGSRPWRISLEEPRDDIRVAQQILDVDSFAVSTSGNHRRQLRVDGRLHAHGFDMETGWPLQHRLVSVTVVEPSAMRADGLSSILMVMGPEHGWAFALSHDIAAAFVTRRDAHYEVQRTPAFNVLLTGKE